MNSMNDERFFDLAMKVIARQATDAECAELDAMLASQPELKAEFERLQTEVRIAKEALPLVAATEATASELPGYARARLQTKVRQTLGRPAETESKSEESAKALAWGWRWWLGLAAATALVVLVFIPMLTRPAKLAIQVAMLDVAGASRGGDTNGVAVLREAWKDSPPQLLSTTEELAAWEKTWPRGGAEAAKIVYDKATGEVRVTGRWEGKAFSKVFPVDGHLADVLKQTQAYLAEQTGR